MQSLNKSLKSAVSAMSERQDRIEETSFARIAVLNNQISDLLHIISSQRSPPNQSSDNHFHFQDSISPASHESFLKSPTRANSPDLPCTDCEKVFPTLPNIHRHILADHPTVTSPILLTPTISLKISHVMRTLVPQQNSPIPSLVPHRLMAQYSSRIGCLQHYLVISVRKDLKS